MTESSITYTFEGDEIFAIHESKVIASGSDLEKVESDAVKYLESLQTSRDAEAKEKAKKKATHVITPNGVKGEILGRTPGVWGEQVTARFENGRIATIAIHGDQEVEWVSENIKTAATNDPTDRLAKVLETDYERDRESLVERHDALLALTREASRFIVNGTPYPVEVKLDQLRTAAEHERRQVKEAIDHLDAADAESFIPEAPFQPSVVEQADLGSGSDWLDVTTQQMIEESEGQDYEKLLREGPALFATELETATLADQGVTREMALSHIIAKTAGFQGDEVDDFRQKFVARVEVARRHELADRKESNHKEAAAAEEVQSSTPDEALFM